MSWASERARLGNVCPSPPSQGDLEAPGEEAALKANRWEKQGTGTGSRKSGVLGLLCWEGDGEEPGGNHSPQPAGKQAELQGCPLLSAALTPSPR